MVVICGDLPETTGDYSHTTEDIQIYTAKTTSKYTSNY